MPNTSGVEHLGIKLAEAMRLKAVALGVDRIRQTAVAKEFKVKPPSVNEWLKFGRIDKEHYPRLVDYFELPYEWWFGPTGEPSWLRTMLLLYVKLSERGQYQMLLEARDQLVREHPEVHIDIPPQNPPAKKPEKKTEKARPAVRKRKPAKV